MIERLATGSAGEKRAGDVHHVRRARAFVYQRRATALAKAAGGFRGLVVEAGNPRLAFGNAKTLAPASDISGVGRAMRAPASDRMIVPGPARRHIDLEADAAAQALALGWLAGGNRLGSFSHCVFRLRRHCEERKRRSNRFFTGGLMDRFAALAMTISCRLQL